MNREQMPVRVARALLSRLWPAEDPWEDYQYEAQHSLAILGALVVVDLHEREPMQDTCREQAERLIEAHYHAEPVGGDRWHEFDEASQAALVQVCRLLREELECTIPRGVPVWSAMVGEG